MINPLVKFKMQRHCTAAILQLIVDRLFHLMALSTLG
jgi:hypothetical protein